MRKYISALAALVLAASALGAQSFQQALFLDGYRLGYRYNPALQNESGFIGVGQWEDQTRNNFGAASFLYPRDGELVTALHSSVPAETFLGSLQDDNYLVGNINFNLVSYGWRRDASYHTVEANIRAMYSASVPKEIFAIAKLGTADKNYDLSGMGLAGNAIVELAYGYSHNFSDIVSIGARAKLLVGVEALNYRVSRFDMSFSEELYKADIEADLDLTSRWNKIRSDENGYLNLLDLSARDRWKLPSGVGLAMDLGVVVTPFEGFTLSASALDLGGMLWYYGNAGKSQGTAEFTGVKNLSMEEIQDDKIMDQFSGVLDDLLGSVRIKEAESRTSLEFVPLNVNLGIKYEMPFYRALALGVTGNYIGFNGLSNLLGNKLGRNGMSYLEVRGALAWNPWNWLGITGGGGYGSYGPVWNAAANVGLGGFRLTVGYSDGFGGTIPYSSTPLEPNFKMVTVGLTYDI